MYSRFYPCHFIAITGITAIADEVLLARERDGVVDFISNGSNTGNSDEMSTVKTRIHI